jgi:hypothetical protein
VIDDDDNTVIPMPKHTMRILCILIVLAVASNVESLGVPAVPQQSFEVVLPPPPPSKRALLESLDRPTSLNAATRERTALVQALTTESTIVKPGSTASFSMVAPGTWSVVYAPHIYTLGLQGQIDPVLYMLKPDGTIISHGRLRIPILNKSLWLSVSGTYSSQDEDITSRVDFDKVWIKWNNNGNDANAENDKPYPTLDSVPDSIEKTLIQSVGSTLFIDAVSIFPVLYLDTDLTVFNFDLLGTRICARKLLATTATTASMTAWLEL